MKIDHINYMENYKEIPGYEGLYAVSDLGNVMNLLTNKVLKPQRRGVGYVGVVLCNPKKRFRVHQLVAMAFLDHQPNGTQIVVDHINGVRDDNRLENLQLITTRANVSRNRDRSLPTGVYKNTKGLPYRARIWHNDRLLSLGTFDTPEAASAAYQKALCQIT